MSRTYSLTIRNRAAALVIGVAVLGLGAVFLTVGLAILAGLAVAGGLIGTGFALVRRLGGAKSDARSFVGDQVGLDPALEIQPKHPAIVAPVENDAAPVTKSPL
jgi:hypothetical protein